MLVILFVTTALISYANSLPVTQNGGTIKYDQRQEGDINVRADLENFVILVIPTSPNHNIGLFDLLAKAIPVKSPKKKQHVKESTENFIESKTAPYHVDISRSESHLQPQIEKNEEILNLRPKNEGKREIGRFAKAILITAPLDEELEQKDESRKIVNELQLLGAEFEQCGPDGFRDSQGRCRYTPVE